MQLRTKILLGIECEYTKHRCELALIQLQCQQRQKNRNTLKCWGTPASLYLSAVFLTTCSNPSTGHRGSSFPVMVQIFLMSQHYTRIATLPNGNIMF